MKVELEKCHTPYGTSKMYFKDKGVSVWLSVFSEPDKNKLHGLFKRNNFKMHYKASKQAHGRDRILLEDDKISLLLEVYVKNDKDNLSQMFSNIVKEGEK